MSKKVKRSVALILCMVFAFGIWGCNPGAKSGPEGAIKAYFDACNEMSMQAIHDASFPEGKMGATSSRMLREGDYTFYNNWVSYMGFTRSKFDMADWVKFDPEFAMFDDYTYVAEGENGELVNRERERITIKEALPDFSVDYDVEELVNMGDCSVYIRDGLEKVEITNMDEIVTLEDGSYLDVDDMYVAQLKVEWYYKDNLYGYSKRWWNDEDFCKVTPYDTYDDAVKECADTEYYVFVYKYNNEWYVYPECLNMGVILYEIEF